MSGPDDAGIPLSDMTELELRERLTVLEQRLRVIAWVAVLAEVGVICLACIIVMRKAEP